MITTDIQLLIDIFYKICKEFKLKIDFNKLIDREYFIRQKININYSLVGELFNLVSYIDSSQFVSRLYTEANNNIGISLEALKKINDTFISKIIIIKDSQIVREELFIY